MTIYYLYVKTHNISGLKYLGQTRQDPFKYLGSGKYWKNHLNVHGKDISTKILRECHTSDEIKYWGIYYNKLWNIVENAEWANLKIEDGTGGDTSKTENYIKQKHLFSRKGKDNPRFVHGNETVESRKNRTENGPGRGRWGNRKFENRNYDFNGDKNPNSKSVVTPGGIFSTVSAAAKFHNIGPDALRARIKKMSDYYYYNRSS